MNWLLSLVILLQKKSKSNKDQGSKPQPTFSFNETPKIAFSFDTNPKITPPEEKTITFSDTSKPIQLPDFFAKKEESTPTPNIFGNSNSNSKNIFESTLTKKEEPKKTEETKNIF